MSSFLFEKQEINCACFNVSPKEARRIFRSQSYHSTGSNNKDIKQSTARNQNEFGKAKKKSLKKQKPSKGTISEKDQKQKQETNKDLIIEIPKQGHTPNQIKKQSKLLNFDYFDSGKVLNLKNEKVKTSQSYRGGKGHVPLLPQSFTQQIEKVFQIEKQYQKDNISPTLAKEFQKDFHDFKLHMLNRQKEPYPHPKQNSQRQSLNKISLDKIQSLNLVLQKSNNMSARQQYKSPNRQASFRNSAVSYREKQSITKRMKGRMMPKQIESENDGNQTQSDEMSEVVGRGWEGLTQQQEELQELDKMNKKQTKNTEKTMVTQESHIRNSEIKTFTDYSNSFISPKSQYNQAMPFGGGHKYGRAGMSYQLIDDLGKHKKSHPKIHF